MRSSDAHTDEPTSADSSDGRTEHWVDAEPSDWSFVGPALAAEGALALIGWAAGVWSGIDWIPMVRLQGSALLLGVGGGFGLVVCHLLLVIPGGRRNPLYRSVYVPLRDALRAPMQMAHVSEIVLLALASGVGEEVFFRGWLQTQAGIGLASVLFGACHVWGRDALPYGLYATGMGGLLGLLFEHSGHLLWAPVLAHVVNNLLGFLALKYSWLPEDTS